MTNDDTKINIHKSILKNEMNRDHNEQDMVFDLANKPALRRPYGCYGSRRRPKTDKTHHVTTTTAKLSASQHQGRFYEALAIKLLEKEGLTLVAKNLLCPMGEIDCVMYFNNTLVFVEVRQRSRHDFGHAAASISTSKQRRLKLSANYFLPKLCRQLRLKNTPYCRFDVVTFDGERQRHQWFINAFS